MKLYILIAVLLAGFITSCHKNTIPNVPINPEMYNAFAFKEGSYWIYQDSANGEIDSFVIDQPTGMNQADGTNITESQYRFGTRNYRNDTLTSYWTYSLQDSSIGFSIWDAAERLEGVVDYELAVFPFTIGQRTRDYDSGLISNIFSLYIVLGSSYNNVCEVNHTKSTYNSTQVIRNDWFYIAENIGLIKVILNHPQDTVYHCYQLIRYKIVK